MKIFINFNIFGSFSLQLDIVNTLTMTGNQPLYWNFYLERTVIGIQFDFFMPRNSLYSDFLFLASDIEVRDKFSYGTFGSPRPSHARERVDAPNRRVI